MLQSTLSRRAARVRTWTRAQSTVASLWPQWPSRWLAYQRPDAVSAQAALQVGVDPAIDADVMSPPTLIAALIDAAHIVSGASWLAAGVGVTLALRCALLPTSMRGTLLQTMLRTLTPEATVRFRGARDAFLKR
jgi:hypothetical protein